MSEDVDYSSKSPEGGEVSGLEDSILEVLSLPRIEVSEDSIVVFEEEVEGKEEGVSDEEDWTERDVARDSYEEEVLDEEIVSGLLNEGDISGEDVVLAQSELEVAVGGVLQRESGLKDEGDLYETGKVSDFYDSKDYDARVSSEDEGGADEVYVTSVKVSEVVDLEEVRRGGRSMLEIAGFRDEEAEKKRKAKRDNLFG